MPVSITDPSLYTAIIMEKKEPKPLLPDYNANIENKHAPNPSWEKYKDIKKVANGYFEILFIKDCPIFSITPTTRAFPIKNARFVSVTLSNSV